MKKEYRWSDAGDQDGPPPIALPPHIAGFRHAGPAGGNRPRLRKGCGLREHAESLCEGLGRLRALVPNARSRPPAALARTCRPLHRPSGFPQGKPPALSVSSIERRLSGLVWGYRQRGQPLDGGTAISSRCWLESAVVTPARLSRRRRILPEDLRAMLATLPHDLRGLRDRAVLLIGLGRWAAAIRDRGPRPWQGGYPRQRWLDRRPDQGLLISLRGKTGWREVEIARGSSDQTCPVHALTQWACIMPASTLARSSSRSAATG